MTRSTVDMPQFRLLDAREHFTVIYLLIVSDHYIMYAGFSNAVSEVEGLPAV